jgi:hypothetical protein
MVAGRRNQSFFSVNHFRKPFGYREFFSNSEFNADPPADNFRFARDWGLISFPSIS